MWEANEDAICRNASQTWATVCLLFTVLLLVSAVDTPRYYAVTALGPLGGSIGDVSAVNSAARAEMGVDTHQVAGAVHPTGVAPERPGKRSEFGPAARARKEAWLVVLLTAQRARSLIALSR